MGRALVPAHLGAARDGRPTMDNRLGRRFSIFKFCGDSLDYGCSL